MLLLRDTLFRCPRCTGVLDGDSVGIECRRCAATYSLRDGFANLLIDEPFEDHLEEEELKNEENTGRFFAESYLTPLLGKLHAGAAGEARVLSVGCGVGTDVDALCARGFDAYGIDPGNRSAYWSRRAFRDRLAFGDSKHLPFSDASFDFAFMNCVLTHVGVVGDSYEMKADYDAERRRAVGEVIRVVKNGGHVLVANPNRACPLDLFHAGNGFGAFARIHSTAEPFLLSFRDHEEYFVRQGGCRGIETLPLDSFFGFFSSSKSLLGRMAQKPVKSLFSLLSREKFTPLRKTWINPWLVVLVEK
jgi:SAM-dependent methyltransferase